MSSENYQMLAQTFSGLEEVLKNELVAIGATDVEVVVRGVKFSGSKELMYRANFCCRTAIKLLRIIGEFKIRSSNDLYDRVQELDWSEYFDLHNTFAIYSTVNSEAFNNSMFVSLKTKDAIVDQFRAKSRKRPTVNNENPDITIHVHSSADSLTLMLDSSGESLHKRGYRVAQNEASMNEILAAGILKLSGWNGKCDFYDTMCGSGTLPVEAALMARNIPPGIFRKEFAFEKWKDFDADLFEEVYNDDYEMPFEHKIYASDISSINIVVSEKNAKGAGVFKDIEFSTADFASVEPAGKSGLLVINPPYGERMNERQVEPLYTMIGDQLKKSFSGFKAWIFSSSEAGFKRIGLRPSEKIMLNNGSLECSLSLFEVYEGSKTLSKQSPDRQNSRPEGGRRGHFNDVRRDGQRRSDSPGPRRGNFDNKRRDDNRRTDSNTNRRSNNFGNSRDNNRRTDDALEARRSEFHKARLSAYGGDSNIDNKKAEGKGEKRDDEKKEKGFARTERTGKRPRK